MKRWRPGRNRGYRRRAISIRGASPDSEATGAAGNGPCPCGSGRSFSTPTIAISVAALLAVAEILERPLEREGLPPARAASAASEALSHRGVGGHLARRLDEERQAIGAEARHLEVGAV